MMFSSQRAVSGNDEPATASSLRFKLGVIAAAGTAAAALLASLAFAAGSAPTVSSARNSTLQKTVVVDGHGRTTYLLSPETIRHLLCRSSACFALWPPVTVRSRSVRLVAGHGVQGRLGLLRRSDGKLQVTLRGVPLYRYAGDSGKDQVNGEGIKSFGGTWHAVRASSSQSSVPAPMTPAATPTAPTPTPTPPSPSPPPYGY
jgi:predicted lipoprotein with Yx(FWY)xxD motif